MFEWISWKFNQILLKTLKKIIRIGLLTGSVHPHYPRLILEFLIKVLTSDYQKGGIGVDQPTKRPRHSIDFVTFVEIERSNVGSEAKDAAGASG